MAAPFDPRVAPPTSSRRSALVEVHKNQHTQTPLQPSAANSRAVVENTKEAEIPRLTRQNTKTTPSSPPTIIRDANKSLAFTRIGFLGEGGFARVYEVKDAQGARSAIKVITKTSLKTKKAKTKLYAEIKIHRSLDHPNIVKFNECFEDDENVYMTLELCQNGSLMDMLRRRRRFTELEARFFMVQLIGACHFMHTHQVIHRDLKLGNLFLDPNMNVKVGDFGLAALIEYPGERKKTICGTPNYIAPEVLFDKTNGHSFEVDTWSMGVILYTLVIGRPPFQTKDVNTIYKRIRDNQYEFPAERQVSLDAQELIQQILTTNPLERPTLHEILDHPFFVDGTVPPYIPVTAQQKAPCFQPISRQQSLVNLSNLRKRSLLDQDQTSELSVSTGASVKGGRSNHGPSIAQQEREFQKAVQPGSPISALLSSARQPLIVTTSASPRENGPMLRKLTNNPPPLSGKGKQAVMSPLKAPLTDIREEDDAEEPVKPNRELESQKARIVAQMVPSSSGDSQEGQENIPPVKKSKSKKTIAHIAPADPGLDLKPNGFDAVANTLSIAFEAKAKGKLFRQASEDVNLISPKVFIVSWVDYCNKYGMGYALTDGSVGVHFNDSTSMVLAPDKHHVDYISAHRQGSVYVRKNHTVSEYPEDLKSKVYLIRHFERYMMERLYGDYDYTFQDLQRTKGMDFVQKYLRMKHVIVFKLSHDVLQFNFYDHTKMIISSQGLLITHIDKNYNLTRWPLSELMTRALLPPHHDPLKAKLHQKLLDKLWYCKEVLTSIRNAGTGGSEVDISPGKSEAPLR
ncbi:kinase-like domain-containing protein [Hysterangium stoloniferum]|nr:kinase-like domain-containing protein [Hysterangium stoloniferum]